MIDPEHVFQYHPPKPQKVHDYFLIREKSKELVILLNSLCPESNELFIAIEKIREAVMWANASIALFKEDKS